MIYILLKGTIYHTPYTKEKKKTSKKDCLPTLA